MSGSWWRRFGPNNHSPNHSSTDQTASHKPILPPSWHLPWKLYSFQATTNLVSSPFSHTPFNQWPWAAGLSLLSAVSSLVFCSPLSLPEVFTVPDSPSPPSSPSGIVGRWIFLPLTPPPLQNTHIHVQCPTCHHHLPVPPPNLLVSIHLDWHHPMQPQSDPSVLTHFSVSGNDSPPPSPSSVVAGEWLLLI